MTKNDTTVFFLHDDLIKLCTSFLWPYGGISATELKRDIDFYTLWHETVPPIFLNSSVMETDLWIEVPNPMREGYPFYPRRHVMLRPKTVWSDAMMKLGLRLCRERIRECRTYKRCALRWIRNCTSSLELWYFNEVNAKLFRRLKLQHFRPRTNQRFLEECFQQLAFLRPFSASE